MRRKTQRERTGFRLLSLQVALSPARWRAARKRGDVMATILVTGGAGFIGSHVCEALLSRGDRVIALDNFDEFYDQRIKRRNLSECTRHKNFALVEGDIR